MLNLQDEYSIGELVTTNIKYLGLKPQVWGFSRGSKTIRDYLYENDNIAGKIRYDYTYKDGLREIATVKRHIDLYDSEGNIFFTQDITKPMNITQLKRLNYEIREGRMNYLREAAKDLPQFSPFVPEPYKTDFLKGPDAVEMLSNYYRAEMDEYEKSGSKDFENKVLNESNEFMLNVLNLNVRPPDNLFPTGLTIKQSILHQLTGVY